MAILRYWGRHRRLAGLPWGSCQWPRSAAWTASSACSTVCASPTKSGRASVAMVPADKRPNRKTRKGVNRKAREAEKRYLPAGPATAPPPSCVGQEACQRFWTRPGGEQAGPV